MLLDNARPCFSAPKHDNDASVLRLCWRQWHLWRTDQRERLNVLNRGLPRSQCALWRGRLCFLSGPGVCEEGKWWLFFCTAAYFKSSSVMWSWREMSQSLWVHTELLCPWSLTGKQRASCGHAHFILSPGRRFFPSGAGASLCVWLSLPLLVGRSHAECVCGRTDSEVGQDA